MEMSVSKSRIAQLLFLFAALCGATPAAALSGTWGGALEIGATRLPLLFHFSEAADGTTSATMDSPKQNATGIPLNVLLCSADSLSVECNAIRASYTASVMEGKIVGTFSQNGFKLPLTLEPVANESKPEDNVSSSAEMASPTNVSEENQLSSRPQTPVPPFPYVATDTVFQAADGTLLAGTITLPTETSAEGMPMVVMVTGSGPQNRDEEIFGHRPFAVLADYLARHGIASFRYDDRGVGKSQGDFPKADIPLLQSDAESALRFARTLPGVGRCGLLGHSEGGTLAFMTAATAAPDFIISLAGMAVPGKQLLLAQNAHALSMAGFSADECAPALRLIEILFDRICNQQSANSSAPLDINAICRENALDVPPIILQSLRQNMLHRNSYFDSLVSLNPAEYLRKVKCPLLAINGTLDTQVDASANLAVIARELPSAKICHMEGLNHLMQPATTGEVDEYASISQTISPAVLRLIADFLIPDSSR